MVAPESLNFDYFVKQGSSQVYKYESLGERNQELFAYRLNGRWVIGPKVGSSICMQFSDPTDNDFTEVSNWTVAEPVKSFNCLPDSSFGGTFYEVNIDVYQRLVPDEGRNSFAYKHKQRWVIGPEPGESSCWVYSDVGIDEPQQVDHWHSAVEQQKTQEQDVFDEDFSSRTQSSDTEPVLLPTTKPIRVSSTKTYAISSDEDSRKKNGTNNQLLGLYLYKTEKRWNIGPDYTKTTAWLVTKSQSLVDAKLYSFNKEQKAMRRVGLIIKQDADLDHVFVTEYKAKNTAETLTYDELCLFHGNYIKLRDGVYFLGPLKLTPDPCFRPLSPDQEQFVDAFLFNSFDSKTFGYYDKISEDTYRRRQTTKNGETVLMYRKNGRWVIGNKQEDRCRAYSNMTAKHPSKATSWQEENYEPQVLGMSKVK